MDTELARTFLTVIAAGNFMRASERLHLTQSTVSARIRLLEEQLGCRLFVRNKAGTNLTPAGREFQRHAAILVRTVEQARQDVGIPCGFRGALTLGARIGLWEALLLKLLPALRAAAPDVAIRAEIGLEADLMQGLVEGRIDIGVMFTPQSRPGLQIEQLYEERLILVSTGSPNWSGPDQTYVMVDWGPEFRARHSISFPAGAGPALSTNIGWIGLQHILAVGGSGYFPERLVQPYLRRGRLNRCSGVPEFALHAYVVWTADSDQDVVSIALTHLRRLVTEEIQTTKVPPGNPVPPPADAQAGRARRS